MTPKEKAEQLIREFKKYAYYPKTKDDELFVKELKENSKQCALIAVGEIIQATKKYVAIRERVTYSKTGFDNVVHTQYDSFWQEVKQEIEKL